MSLEEVFPKRNVMKEISSRLSFIRAMVVFATVLAVGPLGRAFIVSEEQQFEADIAEAIARARDFQRTMNRFKKEQREREQAGYRYKEIRKREEERRERARRAFVVERDRRPDPRIAIERLEREYLKQLEKEERAREEARKRYIRARDKMREVLRRQAYINEMAEYGLDDPEN